VLQAQAHVGNPTKYGAAATAVCGHEHVPAVRYRSHGGLCFGNRRRKWDDGKGLGRHATSPRISEQMRQSKITMLIYIKVR
jgi:hypothetical protein